MTEKDYTTGQADQSTMKTILLIDGDDDILANLVEYFESEGFHVLSATNGPKGSELASEFSPDLIVCDNYRTQIDGYEVLKLLLGSSKTSNIPFILNSCYSEASDKEFALTHGADDYIVKPFELDAVLRMVNTWLASGKRSHMQATPLTASSMLSKSGIVANIL